MKRFNRVPRKVWLLLTIGALAALWSVIGSWSTLTGSGSPRDAFLDAVADGLSKEPRVSVLKVDHGAGQIIVNVKPTGQKLTLTVTKVEPMTLPDGQVGNKWTFDWKDETGKGVWLGHGTGRRDKTIHLAVPGL
jgi:hypothetical protein